MAVASPIRANGVAKSASFSSSGAPEMAQVADSIGVLADTDASSVASSVAGDNGDSRASDQSVQVLKAVEVVPSLLSSRSEEYRQLFRLPSEEVLVQDFNCAFQENILLQGHMYLFVHYICFYANIFGFETKKILPFGEVSSVQKAKTAGLFPNAIEIIANEKKYFFASFLSRDEAYRLIVDGWTHCSNSMKYLVECQESRSELSTPDNKLDMFERLKSLTQPGSFDNNSVDRNKEVPVEELPHVSSGKEPNHSDGNLLLVQESGVAVKEGPAQAGLSPSVSLVLKPEDIDAPKIPEHYKLVAEAKFSIHPEIFFKLFFSDSSVDFCGIYHRRCGDKNFQCEPWSRHQEFGYSRNASFQHPIKLYLGAKFAQCREAQNLHVYRNSHLVVEVLQQMNDAPYSDYFNVEGIWDVECDENEGNSCILRVYVNVAFSKKTIWKGKIEQATAEECREAYAIWIDCAHELLKKNDHLTLREGAPSIGRRRIHHETVRAKRSLIPELSDDLNGDVSPRAKRSREGTDATSMVSLLRESSNSFYSYLKSQNNFIWIAVAVIVATLLIMQLSIIFLLMGARRVHHLPQESFYSSDLGGNGRAEAISWLERRLHYLKEEMLMVEGRMENMRHEYSSLRAHLQRLERLRPKS